MVASLWIGRPSFLISIVTTEKFVPGLRSTLLTLPTLTPAIRTGELVRIDTADSKTPFTRKPLVNGMSLVKPRKVMIPATTSTIAPTLNALALLRSLRGTRSAESSGVLLRRKRAIT